MRRRGVKTAGHKKTVRTVAELKSSANMSIPEAMRYTGYGRPLVEEKIRNKDWASFPEGKRTRIVTASIIAYQERKVAESLGEEAA
jgi:predicted DNA-binding transcriptional regulator AlpA